MRNVTKLKTQIIQRQSWISSSTLNFCRICGNMRKFGGYSIGIAQIDDEIKEKLIFRICPNSAISFLVSRSYILDMRCFSIGGMKNQHDATFESFGLTEEIMFSFTRLPSSTYSLLSLFLLLSKIWNFLISCSSQSSKLFSVILWLSHKIVFIENILSQFLTWPQNAPCRKYSRSNFDLAAKPQNFWRNAIPHLLTPTNWS